MGRVSRTRVQQRSCADTLIATVSLLVVCHGAVAQTFTGTSFLPGELRSRVRALSADGTAAVDDSGSRPFRWTRVGAMEPLGALPGEPPGTGGVARAVNADGTVIVGTTYRFDPGARTVGFRWTVNEGMHEPPGWGVESPSGVSADGSVVVGAVRDSHSRFHACRWTLVAGTQLLDSPTAP